MIQFGELLEELILYPIPHRQYVFSIPNMLRVNFKRARELLAKLCHCAYESLLMFLRNTIGLTEDVPGAVMSIQTSLKSSETILKTDYATLKKEGHH